MEVGELDERMKEIEKRLGVETTKSALSNEEGLRVQKITLFGQMEKQIIALIFRYNELRI